MFLFIDLLLPKVCFSKSYLLTYLLRHMHFFSVSVPPEIHLPVSSRRHIEVVESETVVMECVVTGTPSPNVQWLKDGQLIDRTDQRYSVSSDGQILTISDAQVPDAGKYSCLARNSAGATQERFDLAVLGTLAPQIFARGGSRKWVRGSVV